MKMAEQIESGLCDAGLLHVGAFPQTRKLEARAIIAAKLESLKNIIADVLATEEPFIGKASVADLDIALAMLNE